MSATNHASSGAWAAAGGIGTVSAVNADSYDADGKIVPQVYHAADPQGAARAADPLRHRRRGRAGAPARTRLSGGRGAININVLWEMGGAQQVLEGVLEQTRGWSPGVTCGAGMPYKLAEIAAALQRQLPADHQLGARVPRAVEARYSQGSRPDGRGGLRRSVAGRRAQRPVQRRGPAQARRSLSARQGAARHDARRGRVADTVPIVMAGGVWFLREWDDWIDNPELGQIAFQFGTRPLLTEESPIPQGWKDALRDARAGRRAAPQVSARPGSTTRRVRNPVPAQPRGAPFGAADPLFARSRRASIPCSSTSAVKAQELLGRTRAISERARAGLHEGFTEALQDARRHGGVRRPPRAPN